tara:strand:+ start:2980 stop:4881 length:1902 start_codon:yes stop_codon:yes gene_type:complete
MARERINPNIRYYLPGDPYYYEVDNLPLQDLQENDMSLQEQVDNLNTRITKVIETPERGVFSELLPYFGSNGVLRVKDGNFIARVNTKANFENGLMERKYGSDADSVTVSLLDPGGATMARTLDAARSGAEQFEAKSAVRTAVIEYVDSHEINIPSFDDDDFTDSDAPDYRIDLLYIQASPGMDESNSQTQRFGNGEDTARLGYVKGGYFRVDDTIPGRQQGDILSVDGLDGKVVGLSQVDILNREEGTIPAPDDIVNRSYKDASLTVGAISHTPGISTVALDVWAEEQQNNLGVFCLPVAYIKVPRGYLAGAPIAISGLVDIRPFFRSAELTLSERQAIATSHAPSLYNRFMTVQDPDYQHLKNVTVQGQGSQLQQDHEGRIQTLESKMREQANLELYQPVNVDCMEGQEETPFYLDSAVTDPAMKAGMNDFNLPHSSGFGDNQHHYRRNSGTYKKTVRSMRYEAGPGQWMLYTQIVFNVADEGHGTSTRDGAEYNNASRPMPSGFYRLNLTALGYTGAGVDSIICTPNMEEKWGGDAWAYDIFRQADFETVDPDTGETTSQSPAFIDLNFGCTDTSRRIKVRDYPSWRFWNNDVYETSWTEGQMRVSLTLIGLSVTPDLHSGAQLTSDIVY